MIFNAFHQYIKILLYLYEVKHENYLLCRGIEMSRAIIPYTAAQPIAFHRKYETKTAVTGPIHK